MSAGISFRTLPGLQSYTQVHALQLELVEQRARGEIGDTVLLLEHHPVITRGRGLQWSGGARPTPMPLGAMPEGIEFAESERGGDLTYHGPGQLVVYPIVHLKDRDVEGYLRRLEAIVCGVLASWHLEASSRPGAAGVWVGQKKVASIGIAVRRWVAFHGMAINCVNDLGPFRHFSPCGFPSEVMVRIQDLLDAERREAWLAQGWREALEERMMAEFRKRF